MTMIHRTSYRRRSLPFRCAALAWAVIFLLSGMRGALAQVECAHHVAVLSAETQAEAPHPHDPGHAGPVAEHGDATPDSQSHSHPCTCVGPCQGAGAAPPPTWGSATAAWAAVVGASPSAPAAGELLPGRAPFVLPFPNAPPAQG